MGKGEICMSTSKYLDKGERRKKVCRNWVSSPQYRGQESGTVSIGLPVRTHTLYPGKKLNSTIVGARTVHIVIIMMLFLKVITRSRVVINPLPNKPWFFTCLHLENTVGKREIACKEQLILFPQYTSNFSFFPQCSLPIWRSSSHFHHI